MTAPLVTVLLAVKDGGPYLAPAIRSILCQTLGDFELLVIDDGSTDGTPQVLADVDDRRLRVLRNPANIGLAASLNRGIAEARGTYLARMDADDVAMPQRLALQAERLETEPDLVIVGSATIATDERLAPLVRVAMPVDDTAIRWLNLLENPFAHPTVMLRRAALVEHGIAYDESRDTTQDWALWQRLLAVGRGANLPQPLLLRRLHPGMVSERKRNRQRRASLTLGTAAVARMFGDEFAADCDVAALQRVLIGGDGRVDVAERLRLNAAYLDLFERFAQRSAAEDVTEARRWAVRRALSFLLRPPVAGTTLAEALRWSAKSPLTAAGVVARAARVVLGFSRWHRHVAASGLKG